MHPKQEHPNTQENLGGLQKRYQQQHNSIEDFNTPLSKMDRSSNQNIRKDIAELKNALDQMNLTDRHRTFHLKEAKHTCFANTHVTFSKIDYVI